RSVDCPRCSAWGKSDRAVLAQLRRRVPSHCRYSTSRDFWCSSLPSANPSVAPGFRLALRRIDQLNVIRLPHNVIRHSVVAVDAVGRNEELVICGRVNAERTSLADIHHRASSNGLNSSRISIYRSNDHFRVDCVKDRQAAANLTAGDVDVRATFRPYEELPI